ncbi:MAG: transcriptional regulator [Actinomycetota bacterium]|nr:transcriptional regulator [Actinomycetota bacterium]
MTWRTGLAVSEPQEVSSATSALQSLSDVVHQRSRLCVLATLYEAGRCDFAFLSRVTGLTDGNLSRHLQILEEAGLVQIDKVFVGKRPRTLLELTPQGVSAFEHELSVLRDLLKAARPARSGRTTVTRRRPTGTIPPPVEPEPT